MNVMESIYARLKGKKRRIVLPEWDDPRTLKAAALVTEKELAEVVAPAAEEKVEQAAAKAGLELPRLTCVDPESSPDFDAYAAELLEARKHRGMTEEDSRAAMADPLFYGAMMVKKGAADGIVAGAAHATADVMRAAIFCIGTAAGIKTVSSFFIIVVPGSKLAEDGVFLMADPAVNPAPGAEELCDIAISTAASAERILGWEPRVAMLSFSTKGSAKHADVDKVVRATELVKKKKPDLVVDGELQGDAALVEGVGKKKAPGSPVAGRANVLIFPDLDAANISYKLIQRFAEARAIGPVLQGLAKPASDLSRGCKAEEIVDTVAIVAANVE